MATDLMVPFGRDRSGQRLIVEGVVPLDRKVRRSGVQGRCFIHEHRNVGRGGLPRHVHHAGEEWIYVLAGAITIEIGAERRGLGPGESVLAPRVVPHRWANLGDARASLVFLAQPAGTMEAFLEALDGRAHPPWDELEAIHARQGRTLLGPPTAT